MLKAITYKTVSVFMVILMMTLPAFPLLAKFDKVKSKGCVIKSADNSASSLKKLSVLLTQMIEEIREDDENSGKTKNKESGKEVLTIKPQIDLNLYAHSILIKGISTQSVLNGHERDVLLPPEARC